MQINQACKFIYLLQKKQFMFNISVSTQQILTGLSNASVQHRQKSPLNMPCSLRQEALALLLNSPKKEGKLKIDTPFPSAKNS